MVLLNIIVLVLAIRAAFTLQDHVMGFGNLRTLLWVSVVSLPLTGTTWILALLNASERLSLLVPCLSAAVLVHAGFALGGYCFANNRVRENLLRSIMKCLGKKVPLLETPSVVGVQSMSSQNIGGQSVGLRLYNCSMTEFDFSAIGVGVSQCRTGRRTSQHRNLNFEHDFTLDNQDQLEPIQKRCALETHLNQNVELQLKQ